MQASISSLGNVCKHSRLEDFSVGCANFLRYIRSKKARYFRFIVVHCDYMKKKLKTVGKLFWSALVIITLLSIHWGFETEGGMPQWFMSYDNLTHVFPTNKPIRFFYLLTAVACKSLVNFIYLQEHLSTHTSMPQKMLLPEAVKLLVNKKHTGIPPKNHFPHWGQSPFSSEIYES